MPNTDNHAQTPIRIGLLLIDGFALMSYASIVEPFRAANTLAGRELYAWTHIALRGDGATASNGARFVADADMAHVSALPAASALERVFVFAAGDPATFKDTACLAWLRELARLGATLVGISGGPYVLARAGLLEGHRATIHWDHAEALRTDYPDLELEDSLYVIDRKRITCAGGTAGVDLATALIAKDHGHPLAVKVSEWFIRSAPRQSDARQRQDFAERFGTHNPRVLKMLVLLHDTIDTPPTRSELAHAAGVCVRQIERLFRAELGMSVREAGETIRLDHAAHLLKSTGQSVTAVALACGFASASHFSRAFKQTYAVSPRHWKAHKAAVTAIPDQELARIESLRDRKTRAMSL